MGPPDQMTIDPSEWNESEGGNKDREGMERNRNWYREWEADRTDGGGGD